MLYALDNDGNSEGVRLGAHLMPVVVGMRGVRDGTLLVRNIKDELKQAATRRSGSR